MDKKEIKVKENLLYKGKILDLYVDDVKCPNGNLTKREIINHCPGVGILVVNEKGILLERQFRYAYGEEILEIPAGKVEQNENIVQAAIRELKEETGCECNEMTFLGSIYPSTGYTNEIIHLFLAKSNVFTNQNLDEDEFIEWNFYSLEDVLTMIEDGKIKDAKTISAIYFYLHKKH